ncbi:MAG: transglutaminase family protein [Promethearchaeota archaeon]
MFFFVSLSTSYSSVYPSGLSTSDGVSNYNVSASVKYEVEVNFTFTHTRVTPQNYYFKVVTLNDRQPSSPITKDCPPYQESELYYNSITGDDALIKGKLDKFNNTYDLFNATLFQLETITLDRKYNITLNEVSFKDIDYSDIGTYNMSDEIFDLYCNNSELYYERDDLSLISASNSIVDLSDNPIEKAEKICDWVSNYLTYDNFLPAQEKGALWAYNNERGDCSEYSSLMVTLLRIQNIPARKVTGFCISANPSTKPYIGREWNFYAYKTGSTISTNLLGHAWVEYYVENIGWIACDPTWYSSGYDYFNRIDYLRFNSNIGAWFFLPGASPGYNFISEFPFIPSAVCADHDAYNFDYQVKVTVLESDVVSSDHPLFPLPFAFIMLIAVSAIIIIVLVTLLLLLKGKRKKDVSYY